MVGFSEFLVLGEIPFSITSRADHGCASAVWRHVRDALDERHP